MSKYDSVSAAMCDRRRVDGRVKDGRVYGGAFGPMAYGGIAPEKARVKKLQKAIERAMRPLGMSPALAAADAFRNTMTKKGFTTNLPGRLTPSRPLRFLVLVRGILSDQDRRDVTSFAGQVASSHGVHVSHAIGWDSSELAVLFEG